MEADVKLTIAVPTYNGARTLARVLDSFLDQVREGVEVVISNNASTDGVGEIAERYARAHPSVRYFRNETNVGMDRNFDLCVRRARGRFVWILSDDDVVVSETAVSQILRAIDAHPESATIFVNYGAPGTTISRDHLAVGADDFFRITNFRSTLVSSMVVNKALWESIDKERWVGTYWTHLCYLVNANAQRTSCVLHDTFVAQIVHEGGMRWGKNGTFFSVGIDLARLYLQLEPLGYADDVCRRARRYVKDKNYWNIPFAKASGLRVTPRLLRDCVTVFWFFPSFWLVDLPLLLTPRFPWRWAYAAYERFVKPRIGYFAAR